MSEITIGELVRRYRLRADLTQKALAREIGCHHSLISRIERGNVLPSSDFVESFLRVSVLGLTVKEEEEIRTRYEREQESNGARLTIKPRLGRRRSFLNIFNRRLGGDVPNVAFPFSIPWTSQLSALLFVFLALGLIPILVYSRSQLVFHPQSVENIQLIDWEDLGEGDLFVVEPPTLSPTNPVVGQPVTATMVLENRSLFVFYLLSLQMAVRGPNARKLEWEAPIMDFPLMPGVVLYPGDIFIYMESRSFPLPGDYFAEPVLMNDRGKWGGIRPYPRIWFEVAQAPQGDRPSISHP